MCGCSAAKRPNLTTRVFSGCSDSAHRFQENAGASFSCCRPTMNSSALRTMIVSPLASCRRQRSADYPKSVAADQTPIHGLRRESDYPSRAKSSRLAVFVISPRRAGVGCCPADWRRRFQARSKKLWRAARQPRISLRVALGTLITKGAAAQIRTCGFPHTAPASSPTGTPLSRRIVCAQRL
jgi:hypothetical protein